MTHSYGTLSQTINGLKEEGYILDFNNQETYGTHNQNTSILKPRTFKIDKVYRFEGASNPDDQCILYAISSQQLGLKGTLVNGYGISADEATNEVVSKLRTNQVKK